MSVRVISITDEITNIIIGQECICPDGLGRVVRVVAQRCGNANIVVDTYVDSRFCEWASHNVELIPLSRSE